MFVSLKRIVYKTTNLAEAKEWYIKILEMQPVFDSPFVVIFNINDCSLSLSKTNQAVSEIPETTETFWEVDNIDETYQKLIENHAQVHTPIKDIMNIRIAKVIDPFGNIIGLSGNQTSTKERTVEKKPSETALSVAFCRALAFLDEREEIKGADFLAELFLNEEARKILGDNNSRIWAVNNLITPPLYGYFLSRTKYIDGIFIKQLSEEIPQIVLLGAGYDTRAFRYRELLKNTRVFELDINSTQNNKTDILKKSNIEIPGQLSFVSIDFKQDDIAEALIKSGYNENAKTLFIWEGVTYYLQEEAIISTLQFIHNHSGNESMICFDYLTGNIGSINPAEPFLFRIDSKEIEQMLAKHGVKLIENIGPHEIEAKYLTLKDGSLAEKTLPFFCLATARVDK